MTCRLTNDQLKTQAKWHRDAAARFKGPTHIKRGEEEQSSFYRTMQIALAELYEELVKWRELNGL